MAGRGLQLLKLSFVIGTVADAIVAANWFLIALGAEIPNMLAGLMGWAQGTFHLLFRAIFLNEPGDEDA